jgi:hypothetical protein|tara:strand:- start:70 stop:606 length:537 start_codon:yes stop_codon:yes gene_type:complete
MALASKKYEKFYETTGTGKDKIDTTKLSIAASAWAAEKAEGCRNYMADPIFAPIIYQMQQMQDELDELRNEISDNKDKTTFPGFGTSSTTALRGDTSLLALGTSGTTALAGDTTTITTAQANEITANTAKVSQGLATANHTMQFDVVNTKGTYTLTITIIDSTNAKTPVTKSVTLTLK